MTDRKSYDSFMALRQLVQEAGGEPGPWRNFGNWTGLNDDMRLHLMKQMGERLARAQARGDVPVNLEDHW